MASSQEPHDLKDNTVTDAAPSTPHQAAHRVFDTPELLCNIAAHLSRKEIFVAIGVCRHWRNTLLGDPAIQQSLFLKPIEIREVIAEDFHILDLKHPIPIQECTIIGELNPWISNICGHVHLSSSLHPSINFDFLSCRGLWREMFVTQPPCKAVTVFMDSYPLSRDVLKLKFEREAGIKIGELYDFIEEEMRYHPERRGTQVGIKNFETEEYEDDLCFLTTKCESQDFGSEDSDDDHDGGDGTQGIVGYEDYEFGSDEAYSGDDEDPDEFAAEQADDAD